jgi:hypothetical protein
MLRWLQENSAWESAGLDKVKIIDGHLVLFSVWDRFQLTDVSWLEMLEADHDLLKAKYNEAGEEISKLQELLLGLSSHVGSNNRGRGSGFGRGIGCGGRGVPQGL